MLRDAGVQVRIVEYLKTPPGKQELAGLIRRMGVPVRSVLRQRGTPYAELHLDDPKLSDGEILDAMIRHPILIERPIVVTGAGVRLCRPAEKVFEILPPRS
jgi:arsenate reductase